MASFIEKALAASGVSAGDGSSANTDLSKLSMQSDELKVEIMTYLKSWYEDFDVYVDKTCTLYKRVEDLNNLLTSTLTLMQYKTRQDSSGADVKSSEVQKTTETLNILEILLQIHKLYQETNSHIAVQDYGEASTALANMLMNLEKLKNWPDLEITKSLKREHILLVEMLKYSLTEGWNKLLKVTLPGNEDKDKAVIAFTVNKTMTCSQVSQLVNTLNTEGMLNVRMKPLTEAINLVFDWVINHPGTTVKKQQSDLELRLEVIKNSSSREPNPPPQVFPLLQDVLQPLDKHLLYHKLSDKSVTLMSTLGTLSGKVTVNKLIKECLAPSVPTSQIELDNYKQVVRQTEEFEKVLHKLHFLDQSETPLTMYVSNLNILFANRKCQDILSQARKLMKMDLYNTVRLKPGDDSTKWSSFISSSDPIAEDTDTTSTANVQTRLAKLSENTLKFPLCSISDTTVKLMSLAHSMLEEACTSSNSNSATHIVYSVRSIFELYTSVVPDYHKENIESLPQITALHYNNCMYISHQLIMLANQYRAKLSTVLGDSSSITFVDLVPLLRAIGTEAFIDQLQSQREDLLNCLRASEGFKKLEVDDKFQKAHQSIKQCKLQLEHLKKVWLNILPMSNYCKSIGHLLCCVMKEIIISVLAIEDFTADGATKLHQLMTEIQDMSPGLFPGDKSTSLGHAHKHVTCWTKFKELSLVLTASLQDIVDRWAEGKGPLAVEFTAMQVKGMIRALFQNTDRRSACLGKIN